MAKIGKLINNKGVNIYPGTIPQAVVDPTTKQNLRDELDALYADSIVIEDDTEEVGEVDTVAADTATKALNDWDGNDIRATYVKTSSVDSSMSASSENPVQNKVAKAYSDTNLATAKSYSDTNLATSKSYADGKLTEAKNYSDSNLAAAKSYADGLFKVVTESEYSALGTTVNSDGVIYFITE